LRSPKNKFQATTIGIKNSLKQWPISFTITSSNIQARPANGLDLDQREHQRLYAQEEVKLLKQEERAYIATPDYTKTII
jgi:hypothetical protein